MATINAEKEHADGDGDGDRKVAMAVESGRQSSSESEEVVGVVGSESRGEAGEVEN